MTLPYKKELLSFTVLLGLFVILQFIPNVEQQSDEVFFDITSQQWKFEPNTIAVKQGQTVVIRITSVDVPHGFALDDYNIYTFVPPGQTVDIKFIATEKGTFEFFCNVYCGEGHSNHRGMLIVS